MWLGWEFEDGEEEREPDLLNARRRLGCEGEEDGEATERTRGQRKGASKPILRDHLGEQGSGRGRREQPESVGVLMLESGDADVFGEIRGDDVSVSSGVG